MRKNCSLHSHFKQDRVEAPENCGFWGIHDNRRLAECEYLKAVSYPQTTMWWLAVITHVSADLVPFYFSAVLSHNLKGTWGWH